MRPIPFSSSAILRSLGMSIALAAGSPGLVLHASDASSEAVAQGLSRKLAGDLPAAATAFRLAVSADAKDLEAREQLATVTGWQGDHQGALALWNSLLELAPERRSARLGKARVLYWLGRLPDSRDLLEELVSEQPKDLEAQELLGDVARASGHRSLATTAYQAAGTPEALAKLERLLATPAEPTTVKTHPWRLDAGLMVDQYAMNDENAEERVGEHSLYVQAGRQLTPGFALSAGLERARQFSQVDHRVNVHAYWSPLPKWSFDGLAATTPAAHVLPRQQIGGGGEYQALSELALVFAVQSNHYDDEQVITFAPGIRWEFLPEATIEARYIRGSSSVPEHEGTKATLLKVAWSMAEIWHPYALYSVGDENQPPLGTAQVTTYAAGTIVDLSPTWSLRLDGLVDVREDTYVRTSLGGGFIWRF